MAEHADELERRAPERFALSHFGVADDPQCHLERLRARFELWLERVRSGITEQEFVAVAGRDVGLDEGAELAELYDRAGPYWLSYHGMARYWEKRREREALHEG